jgi:hypothetical protein
MNNPMQMIFQMMQMGNNPQQILNTIVNQNPQARALMNQINNSGMSPQDYLRQYAKQNNIDLDKNPMVQMLKSRGAKF